MILFLLWFACGVLGLLGGIFAARAPGPVGLTTRWWAPVMVLAGPVSLAAVWPLSYGLIKTSWRAGVSYTDFRPFGPHEMQSLLKKSMRPSRRPYHLDLHLGRLTTAWNLTFRPLPFVQIVRYDTGYAVTAVWLKTCVLWTPFPIPKEKR